MNGEQRPYWLYYNEMDYIISHFPGHRPRINLDASNSVSATSTPNSANTSLDGSTSNANQTEFADIKPTRSASISAANMDTSKCLCDSFFITFVVVQSNQVTMPRKKLQNFIFSFILFIKTYHCPKFKTSVNEVKFEMEFKENIHLYCVKVLLVHAFVAAAIAHRPSNLIV